jgi:hypothetical protein
MSQAERFRDKIRARNLGLVEVQTYPANPEAAYQQRALTKLERHRKLEQEGALGADPKPAEDKAKDPEPAKVEAPPAASDPKPKADPKPAEDKRK